MKKIFLFIILILFVAHATTAFIFEEEVLKVAQEIGSPIIFDFVNYGKPNSVGGVNLNLYYKNVSDKTFKYVYISVIPYNAVDDVVICEIRRNSIFNGRVTGPSEPGKESGYIHFENAWYNHGIRSIEIIMISVDFMDGSTWKTEDKEIIKSLIARP